jgi:hypothetical protein
MTSEEYNEQRETRPCSTCGRFGMETDLHPNNNGLQVRCPHCGSKRPWSSVLYLKQNERKRARRPPLPNGETLDSIWEKFGDRCVVCSTPKAVLIRLSIGRQVHHVLPYAQQGHKGLVVPICTHCHSVARERQRVCAFYQRVVAKVATEDAEPIQEDGDSIETAADVSFRQGGRRATPLHAGTRDPALRVHRPFGTSRFEALPDRGPDTSGRLERALHLFVGAERELVLPVRTTTRRTGHALATTALGSCCDGCACHHLCLSVQHGTAVALTPPCGALGISYQSSLGPFPRPVSHAGSFRGPSDSRGSFATATSGELGPRKPHMAQDTRCPYCGLLVQAPHENDAACVAALKAAVTDTCRYAVDLRSRAPETTTRRS